jgi:hypothetical protein
MYYCYCLAGISVNLKFEIGRKPRIGAPDESNDGRLPSLSKTDIKVLQDLEEGNGLVTSENRTYMDYYDEEVGMIGVDSMVMNEAEDEKNRMINMAIEKNGQEILDMKVKSWCKVPIRSRAIKSGKIDSNAHCSRNYILLG